ncbi:type II secretion system protein [Alicyclobacillus fodiniaquatilis]|jgi:general secretion pathway protein G|uniref:Type II secretion system protein n=1 Tax=Alicyclobacillus fodiniaquatilis TaxID=1661150 RepID=A0ABW4JH45_9BACL
MAYIEEGRMMSQEQRQLRKIRGQQGFSLLELMVAVAIVAIMIAVLTPHLLGASKQATDTACQSNEKTIEAALAEYDLIHQQLPTGDTVVQIQALVADHLLDKDVDGSQFTIDDTDPDNITVTCTGDATNETAN